MNASVQEERVVWEGTPSQWLGIVTYLVSGIAVLVLLVALVWVSSSPPTAFSGNKGLVMSAIAALFLVPAFFVLKKFLTILFTRYKVTTERTRITTGIFSKRTEDLELYRVDDMIIDEPFLLRLVRKGNVVAMSSDRTTPNLVLEAIPDALALRDQMRKYVEICRDRKRTRVLDME